MVLSTTIFIYTERVAYNANKQEEYHGWAIPNTGSATAGWMIRKTTYDANFLMITQEWAEGNKNLDKKWTLKATYSYS